MLRDVLVQEILTVLHTGLYAVPALIGATIVAVASKTGTQNRAISIIGATVCFVIRVAGLHFDLNLPQAPRRSDRDSA